MILFFILKFPRFLYLSANTAKINNQIPRCRATGYLTLAAVAKCLQAATWLVARGNKKAAHYMLCGRSLLLHRGVRNVVKYFPDCCRYDEGELIRILSVALQTRECQQIILKRYLSQWTCSDIWQSNHVFCVSTPYGYATVPNTHILTRN